jgi:hypothetical protein
VREIDDVKDAVNQGEAECDKRIDRSRHQTIHDGFRYDGG